MSKCNCRSDITVNIEEDASKITLGALPLDISINSSNPKDVFGRKKSPLELLPPTALVHVAQAFKEGIKYGPFNWRSTTVSAMVYIGSADRHIAQYVDGEDYDPDAAVLKHHLAGAIASLMILLDALETGHLIDDRPPAGTVSALMKRFEEKK